MAKETILRIKPVSLLVVLKDTNTPWCVSTAARRANLSYIHATKTLLKFEQDGVVLFERKGRTKQVKLTERGLAVASLLDELIAKLAPPSHAQKEAKERDTKEVKEGKEKEVREEKR
ncbi:MAG: hypothetical protein AB1468_02715 [Candidatus Micrarchaeota archaeon]